MVEFRTTVACVPQCAGKKCGTDGCGGTCGSCPANAVCNSGGTSCECRSGYLPDPTFSKCVLVGGGCSGTGVDQSGYCADNETWVWCDPRHGIVYMDCPAVVGTKCLKASSTGTWGACGCGAIDSTNGVCGSVAAGSANEVHYYCSPYGILFATNCKATTGSSSGLCSTYVTSFGWQTSCFCIGCRAYDYSGKACYSLGSTCSYDSASNLCACY